MATFKKAKSNTFQKKVSVFCGDESLGDLDVTYLVVSQDELVDLAENETDAGLCRRVIKSVGDIPVEDSEEVLKGEDAIKEVLSDARAVSACARTYIECMKGDSFRHRGSARRR
ncbi:MAG: hypothetical protein P1V33_03515 [Pseudohongiella nitratireducens]|nr:hypothetical protein [Pseudohongiella nitratireducens]MDF1622523.1 hypothetical protein [Pseudohongiella nitratireducens]